MLRRSVAMSAGRAKDCEMGKRKGSLINRVFGTLSICGALALCSLGSAGAGTIDKVRQDKTLRLAYRNDAPPFSFTNEIGEPAGFMVELCRSVAKNLAAQLNIGDLKVSYMPVTAADRFETIQTGKADLLCEPTSATLSRREQVDFSIPTFVDGASLLVSGDGLNEFSAFAGKRIGVLGGTTTEQSLRDTLISSGVAAEVMPAKTHEEGLAMLDQGTIAAYFADRAILTYLASKSRAPDKLRLASNYLSVESYALAMPRGDDDFRLAVDRALSRIYRSGVIGTIFAHSFGEKTQPSDTLKTLYLISALPE
jgi:ABC-type amino acid transport substrate-binding protein